MLSSPSFNRYRRKSKMGLGRRYYKTNFKNRCRRQNKCRITFNGGFNQYNELKMNKFNCGCKIVVTNHTVSYNFDTAISDKINYDYMYRTLDMVARGLYYDDYYY